MMVICICANYTESEIRGVIQRGYRTMEDLMYETGVALGCGMCRLDVERILISENECQYRESIPSNLDIAVIKPF